MDHDGQEASERRFVVDSMLGKVAKWLRILGFDTRYERLQHEEQVDRYGREGFLLVTRNQRWRGHSGVFCTMLNAPMEQLRELVGRIPIFWGETRLLHRCILCNRLLERISRNEALGCVPDYVFETSTVFSRCPHCERVYWPGSHPERMMESLMRALGWSSESKTNKEDKE